MAERQILSEIYEQVRRIAKTFAIRTEEIYKRTEDFYNRTQELYSFLTSKAEILLNRRWSFAAGTPSQLLLDYIVDAKYADFPVIIYIHSRSINADAFLRLVRASVGATPDESVSFLFNNNIMSIKTVLRAGDRIRFEIANISATVTASGSILIAIIKALPV